MASTILVTLLVVVPIVLLAWDLVRPHRRDTASKEATPPSDQRVRPSAS